MREGSLAVGELHGRVLYAEALGFFDYPLGLKMSQWLRRRLATTEQLWEFFIDAEAVSGTHPNARMLATDVFSEYRHLVPSINVLVRSALARMALAVANLTMGGSIKGYRVRREFEAELDRAIGAR